MTPADIIEEGNRRREERARVHLYDPIVGRGSPLERFEVRLRRGKSWFLPIAMQGLGELSWHRDKALEEHVEDFDRGLEALGLLRLFYDFEYWCATCATIERRDGTIGPLILTLPQRNSLAVREAQRALGRPIRQIELKHRRYGSTTEKCFYLFWLQRMLGRKKRLSSYMISLEQGGSAKIARRFEVMAEHQDNLLSKKGLSTTLKAVRNVPLSRQIIETGGMISIASVNNPQGPSGDTAQLFLVSEAGKMASSSLASAERLITNITSIVPYTPGSALLVESTAEQVGQWFRREVERARRGESGYDLHFTCWKDDPVCEVPLDEVERHPGLERWILSWSSYLRELWEGGCTLEQIRWYEVEERQKPNAWMMRQENPTTIDEAFQAGGRRVFPAEHVATARSLCRPGTRGRLISRSPIGGDALEDLTFQEDLHGPLVVWRFPGDDYGGALGKVLRRYVVGADPNAGTSAEADNGVGVVLDRGVVLLGSGVEVVAEWCGKVETRQFAWEMARLALWYNRAELVIEVNTLIEDTGGGHDPSLTVLDEILPYYRWIYHRRIRDQSSGIWRSKAGYFMSRPQKLLAVTALERGLRVSYEAMARNHVESDEDYLGLVERSSEACREYDMFRHHDDGSIGATPKSVRSDPDLKDDRVIARAIAKQISDEMPPPALDRGVVPLLEKRGDYARF